MTNKDYYQRHRDREKKAIDSLISSMKKAIKENNKMIEELRELGEPWAALPGIIFGWNLEKLGKILNELQE